MSRAIAFIDRHAEMIIVLCVLALAVFALSGCSIFSRGSLPACPADPTKPIGLGAQLTSIGSSFSLWGSIIAGLALVAYFVPALLAFRAVVAVVGEFATGTALVGGFFQWLGNNVWMVVLACVLTGLAYAVYRRAVLMRWMARLIKAQGVKP